MFDIITFGSATKDIFLQAKNNIVLDDERFPTRKGVCFSLGSKVKVDKIYFTSGGGGTNTAATFAKQGFRVAYCGKIGNDGAGDNIVKDLNYYGIDYSLSSFTYKWPTSHSVILDVPGNDRTILVYRGASNWHLREDIDFKKLQAKWLYLAPFSKECNSLFYEIVELASSRDIKLMINPGKAQLKDRKLKDYLQYADIILLNAEEASILTGIPRENEEKMAREIGGLTPGIVLITKGVEGVLSFDGSYFYRAKPQDKEAVDRTGAGDSFGAGFLSGYIKSNHNIEKGIVMGIANSTSCLKKMGAKHGLLGKDDEFERVEVEKTALE